MAKNRDSMTDRIGTPTTAPDVLDRPKITLEEALIVLAQAQAQSSLDLAKLTGDREAFLHQEREDKERYDRIRKECEKTAQQRTQEAAERKWPVGESRFRCVLMQQKAVTDPSDPARRRKVLLPDSFAFPEIEINANSEEEARERYRVICFITGTECTVRALTLTGAPVEYQDEPRQHTGGVAALEAAGVTEV